MELDAARQHMKDTSTKSEFIKLRAESLSFQSISDKIGVSKPTLIKWSREFESEIANLKYHHFEQIVSEYALLKEQRLEVLLDVLGRALDELRNRDLTGASPKALMDLVLTLKSEIEGELTPITYRTGEKGPGFDDLFEQLTPEVTIPLEF
jgi:hypothetical protein